MSGDTYLSGAGLPVKEAGDTAFNMGSDARIAGRPLKTNPFAYKRDPRLWVLWRMGWYNVHEEWGKLARRLGLRVKSLAPVVIEGSPC